MQPVDWMVSVNLHYADLHIPILPSFHTCCRFAIGQAHFQFMSLSLDVSTSLMTFTKVSFTVPTLFREQSLRLCSNQLQEKLTEPHSADVLPGIPVQHLQQLNHLAIQEGSCYEGIKIQSTSSSS